jgi:hypothetical protein
MQTLLHYFLHFGAPLLIAVLFYKTQWKKVYLIFIATMFVDADHILATPIFEANRCSINFHPLHSYYAIACYIILLLPKKTRLIAIALLLHMLTDWIDCLQM